SFTWSRVNRGSRHSTTCLRLHARHRGSSRSARAAAAAPRTWVCRLSRGTRTLPHMVVELLAVAAKVNMQHVPYKGVTGAYADVLGGRIDFVADSPASATPNIKAGRFRALGMTTPKRSALLPDVPTVAELGFPAAESDFVTGLL